jgi:hypothetical protein
MAAVALLLCVSVSACGLSRRKRIYNVTESEISAGGQPYFFAGPVTYQVQISRQLNPFSTEDVQYLAGVKGAQSIGANRLWFGVFLWAKNQSGRWATTTDRFTLHDSSGQVYQPVKLSPAVNPFAWTAEALGPNGTEPAPDTTAANGPVQAGLILFQLSQSIYSNRPLTLFIYPPGHKKPSVASLDL